MPLVKADIIEGKSREYKESLLSGIHNALISCFKIPADDRNQRINEIKKQNFKKRENRSDNFTIIELTVFKGRSSNAKKKLYKKIVENLMRSPGIDPLDIIIYINEIPMENWGIMGGKSAEDIDLGFDVNV
jgi:phenylpyruvate tautomerase PptA (4-oxalocrotonate tautomerase family)